jgi:hypothetical protein
VHLTCAARPTFDCTISTGKYIQTWHGFFEVQEGDARDLVTVETQDQQAMLHNAPLGSCLISTVR